jgi:hypothetical protein
MSAIRLLKSVTGLWPKSAHMMEANVLHSIFVGDEGVVGMWCYGV